MKKLRNKKVFIVLFSTVLIVFFISLVFFTQGSSNVAKLKNSFSIYSKDATINRVCSGEGQNFSCQEAFSSDSDTKSKILSKAKYLYLKFQPQGPSISKIDFSFTPNDSNIKYEIKDIELETYNGNSSKHNNLNNLITDTPINLVENNDFIGFSSFSIDVEQKDHLENIKIVGLPSGKLSLDYKNSNKETVSRQTSTTKENEDTEIELRNATFLNTIFESKIENISFTTTSNFEVSKVSFDNDTRVEENMSIKNNNISILGGEEIILEFEATAGSFSEGSFDKLGIDNIMVFSSVSKIEDPRNVKEEDLYSLVFNTSKININLNDSYFNILPLLKSTDNITKNTEYLFYKTWGSFNDNLAITNDITLDLEANGVELSKDFFHLSTNSFSAKQHIDQFASIDYSSDFKNLLENNSDLTKVELENINVGNDLVFNNSEIVTLKLSNTGIQDTSFLLFESPSTVLTKVNELDLSNNDFSDSTSVFTNMKNLSLDSLNLTNTNIRESGLITFISNNDLSNSNLSTTLKSLNVSSNKFTRIPIVGTFFNALNTINLSKNSISDIAFLSNIVKQYSNLNLSENNLTTINLTNISSSLKENIKVLDLSNNPNASITFTDGTETSFSEISDLNIEGINDTLDMFNTWSNFIAPKLKKISFKNINLSNKDDIKIKSILAKGTIEDLNLSNTSLSQESFEFITQNIASEIKKLDISKNKGISKIEEDKFNKLAELNISSSSFDSIPNLKLDSLVAQNLQNLKIAEIVNEKDNFTNLDLKGSSAVFSKGDIKLLNLNNGLFENFSIKPINFDNLFITTSYSNILDFFNSEPITPYEISVLNEKNSSKKEWLYQFLLDFSNYKRKIYKLDESDNLDDKLQNKNVFDPYIFYNTLTEVELSNQGNIRDSVVKDTQKEVSKFIVNDTLEEENENNLKDKFNVSFSDYGEKWSNSYLAAVSLAPIMLVLFITINFYFAYHNNRQKTKRKRSEGNWWKRKKT